MSSPFLSGVTFAWAAAQFAIGCFFLVAHGLRRDRAHLLFGLFGLSVAVASAGLSLMYASEELAAWLVGAGVCLLGTILAGAFNFDFVLSFAGRGSRMVAAAIAAYGASGAFAVLYLAGLWRVAETEVISPVHALGLALRHVHVEHLAIAHVYYALAWVSSLVCVVLLARAWQRGRREALPALVGASLLAVGATNDLMLLEGWLRHGLFALPHASLAYSLAVGIALLLRAGETEGRLLETKENLAQRTEELRRSYQDLRFMQDELSRREQLAAVGELAATIAHEVRNPLAVIVNAAAGLRRDGLRRDDRDMLLGIVDEEVARLNRLVTDLLRFARPVAVSWAPVNLRELAERTRALAPDDVEVAVEIPPDSAFEQVLVDAGLMRLALENLVENACQAMPGGGKLTILAHSGVLDGERALCLAIRDTGRGMEPRVVERALQPFFTTRPQGTGLGLPIVDRIVRAHGGAVELESRVGEGSTVRLLIPLDVEVRRRRRSGATATSTTSSGSE